MEIIDRNGHIEGMKIEMKDLDKQINEKDLEKN